MAKRRMFSVDITDTDKFTEMKLSAQALYFHLGLHADDDGFVASPKRTAKAISATMKDIQILIDNGYLIRLDDSLVVLTHWKAQNHVQPSKYNATVYQEFYQQLATTEGGVYIADQLPTVCRTDSDQLSTQLVSKDSEYRLVSQSDALVGEFEELWQLYPRKEGKKNALEYYVKARSAGVTKVEILDGVKRYAEYVKREKKETRYIKLCSTFMSKESWKDEYHINIPLGVKDDADSIKGVFE